MKKIATVLTLLFAMAMHAGAMSYSQAREQALFLTDKMAYELNLTEEQYDAAYEINLDYLMSVNTQDDLYGAYWTYRNLDMSYILLDWQYQAFCAASYFYRPLYFASGAWHFAIYAHYPHRDYFYFGRPHIYVTYRGGHCWHRNGGRSWYKGRTFNHGHIRDGHGMRDRYKRGYYHRGDNDRGFVSHGGRRNGHNERNVGYNKGRDDNGSNRGTIGSGQNRRGHFNGIRNSGGNTTKRVDGNRGNGRHGRESSTRTTARPNRSINSRSFNNTKVNKPSRTFTPGKSTSGNRVGGSTPKRSVNSNGGGNKSSNRGGRFGGNR